MRLVNQRLLFASSLDYYIYNSSLCRHMCQAKSLEGTPSPLPDRDLIGPKYAGSSNIRQVVFRRHPKESILEKKYRILREETEAWHVEYWQTHNADFSKAKKVFIAEKTLEKQNLSDEECELTAEEMGQFYKRYLAKSRSRHLAYNWQWYKKNFKIVYYALLVRLNRIRRKHQ